MDRCLTIEKRKILKKNGSKARARGVPLLRGGRGVLAAIRIASRHQPASRSPAQEGVCVSAVLKIV